MHPRIVCRALQNLLQGAWENRDYSFRLYAAGCWLDYGCMVGDD